MQHAKKTRDYVMPDVTGSRSRRRIMYIGQRREGGREGERERLTKDEVRAELSTITEDSVILELV